ncbi:MAG: DUF4184 family protein [Planctomycetota bacterium]
MPFTLAHPAAAVPLRKPLGRLGVLSALIVGSMAPDFVYYFPLGVSRASSHGPAGLFWFCVPAGLLAYGLFHSLMRPAIDFLLPPGLVTRLPKPTGGGGFRGRSIAAIVISIWSGAVTHVLWDAFTHGNGYFVTRMAPLQAQMVNVSGYPVTVYKILQHGGTLIGLALLALWAWRWYRTTEPSRDPGPEQTPAHVRAGMALCLFAAGCVAGLVFGMAAARGEPGVRALQSFVVGGAIAATGTWAMCLTATGLWLRLARGRTRARE